MPIESFKNLIDKSSNIVFFGGAGVSTESNIPDFRSEKGIYNANSKYGYSPERILSHTFFMKKTEIFYDFYKNQMIYKDAKPNNAHLALSKLEKSGKLKATITQNIDNLHQLADSKNVLELHGTVYKNHCIKCNEFYDLDYIINSEKTIPYCKKCGGIIKPDVTLYEEGLDMDIWNKAIYYTSHADILIVGGTSLSVYPAASIVDYYKGNKLILINKSQTPYDKKADLIINDSIGEVLKIFLNN